METQCEYKFNPMTPEGEVKSYLSRREYFAAIALQGLLAEGWYMAGKKHTAEQAVEMADNLIKELDR